MSKTWDVAKQGIWIASPLAGLVIQGAELAVKAVSSASDKGIDALKEEVTKQEIRLKFEIQQAKIAQELAIAQRISNADVVEIEEFYDLSAAARAGVQVNEASATIGLGAEGKSVTKRIYQFRGFREGEVAQDRREDVG
jgi:hypothetical protein